MFLAEGCLGIQLHDVGEQHGSYELYLQQLAELEVQQRRAGAIARRLKQAKFPVTIRRWI